MGVVSGGGGGGGAQTVTAAATNVTAAQLKALATTGVQLVAAPGAGKALMPLGLFVQVKFNSVAFTNPSSADIEIVTTASAPFGSSATLWTFATASAFIPSPGVDVFLATADAYWYAPAPLQGAPFVEGSPAFANTPIGLVNFGGNLAAGNGSARFTVYYNVVTLA